MNGYRGVAWFCFSSATLAAFVAMATLRNVGIVGKMPEGAVDEDGEQSRRDSMELPSLSNGVARNGHNGAASGNGSINGDSIRSGVEASVDSKR